MAQKRDPSAIMARMTTASSEISKQDERSTEWDVENRGQRTTVLLTHIKPRESDTRPLNEKHVSELKESIKALGLIEPLVLDNENILLAGGHRLAAIQNLKIDSEVDFHRHFPKALIPVRIMPFSASDEPERALQIEVAENEHRRDYTPSEVRSIAEHLRTAGYVDVKGRPRKGQKPLMPALSVVVGKNLRTIQRYLDDSSKQISKGKSTTDVVLFLKKASSYLKKWQENADVNSSNKELMERLPEMLELIDKAMRDDTL